MKHRSLFIVMGIATIAVAASRPALADDAKPGTLVVTGTGESTAAPDMAVLSLAVVREADDARAALTADNKAMASVLDAMKQAGIEPRDLQTGNFSIQPRYVYPNDKNKLKAPEIVGYTVNNTLTVRVRDLEKVGEILDKSVSLGVNSSGGVAFTNQHPETILDEARRNAMKDALAKAKTLTEAAGIGVGRIVQIRESSNPPRPMPLARAQVADSAAFKAVPVAAGENSYHVNVTVTFELKQ